LAGLCLVGLWGVLLRRATVLRASAMVLTLALTGFLSISCSWDPDRDFLLRHALPVCLLWLTFAGLGFDVLLRLASCWVHGPRWFAEVTLAAPGGTPERTLSTAGVLLVCLLAASTLVATRGFLSREWTHQREFAFFQKHLADVDEGCVIVFNEDNGCVDRGLMLKPSDLHDSGRNHTWLDINTFLAEPPDDECVVFAQQALCHGHDSLTAEANWTQHPSCAEVFTRYVARPIAATRIPAQPFADEDYTVDPVPVGYFRLLPRSETHRGE